MNRLQIVRQVQHILRDLTWTDGNLVFAEGAVLVTLGVPEQAVTELRLPVALIRPGAESIDPDMAEQPGLVRQTLGITLVVANAQDKYGEAALVGANRGDGSDGRGLLELEEVVRGALLALGPASGVKIILRSSSVGDPIMHPSIGYIVTATYTFEALGTVARTYQPPTAFRATGGAGSVALAWAAATRFDARRFILRRASGATPPATSSSGTGVTLGGTPDGSGVTSVTDTIAAGTYSYSLFAVYDDEDASADVAVSDPRTIASVVVT